ncbi:hypothetical protein AB0J81_19985 [Streptomyces bobili]|uniref:hypothetical protein n=1 Tax=Streptomyces bobili TaxID=67280 RepID=UPI0034251C10
MELLVLAAEAAGGRYHMVAVRLPISLVMTPPAPGAGDGLRVAARRRTAGIVDQELADLTRPGLPSAQACVLAVASCPGVTDVLFAASGAPHRKVAANAVAQPCLAPAELREITGVLASL